MPTFSSVTFQLFQRRQQGPGCRLIAVGIGGEPYHAVAMALDGFEPEDRLGRLDAGARDVTGRRAVRIEGKSGWTGALEVALQRPDDGIPPAECSNAPGECQDITPVAVGMEQTPKPGIVGCRQGLLEFGEPTRHRRYEIRLGHRHALSPRSHLRARPSWRLGKSLIFPTIVHDLPALLIHRGRSRLIKDAAQIAMRPSSCRQNQRPLREGLAIDLARPVLGSQVDQLRYACMSRHSFGRHRWKSAGTRCYPPM